MFPPLVTGIVVLMIGVSLLKVGFMYAGGGGWLLNNKPEMFGNGSHLFIAFTVLIVALVAHQKGKGNGIFSFYPYRNNCWLHSGNAIRNG